MSSLRFQTRSGTVFWCADRDLSSPVSVVNFPFGVKPLAFAQEVAEFIGWYTLEVYPTLNGFGGFDAIRFTLSPPKRTFG